MPKNSTSEFGEASVPVGDMLREEIHSVIRRFSQESDVTTYQVLGVLRVIEHDMLDCLERFHEGESDDSD